eukprot:scaffold7181_cov128-Skeletonema_marinoi.AAC.2
MEMVRQRMELIRKLLSTLPAGLAEIQRAFESVVIDPQQPPTHIFMTGDSLLRQNIGFQWREEWPCPEKLTTKCVSTGGQHSGFDAASVRFSNGMEIHFVPHRGFAYSDMSKESPMCVSSFWANDSSSIQRGGSFYFDGIKKDASILCGNNDAIDEEQERRPKIITPTAHFKTPDRQYIRKDRMDGERSKKCVEHVSYNRRAELEKRILKAGRGQR